MDTAELVEKHKIASSWEAQGFGVRDDDGWAHNAYTVKLVMHGRRITTPFRMGTGLKGHPQTAEVLDSLLVDASCADGSFEDFCGNFGYDEDSRKAEKLYRACKTTERKLRRFLDGAYDTFMQADRL